MSDWSIGKRLFTGVSVLVALILLSSGVSIWAGRELTSQLDRTARHTARALNLALSIGADAVALSDEQRHLLLAGLGQEEEQVRQARQALADTRRANAARLAEIEKLLDNAEAQRSVREVSAKLQEWDAANSAALAQLDAGELADAWDIVRQRATPLLEQVRTTAAQLVHLQDQAFAASIEQSERTDRLTLLLTLGVLATSLVAGLVVMLSVRWTTRGLRQMTRELAEGAQQVATTSSQVSGNAQSLSRGATEQAPRSRRPRRRWRKWPRSPGRTPITPIAPPR